MDDRAAAERLAELFDAVRANVTSWPSERRRRGGLHLLVGEEDELRRERRALARVVLVGETVLADIAASHPGPTVLMKGLEVAQLYPSPVCRPFHDLDLLVSDPEPLWQCYRAKGFRSNPNRRKDIDHHHLPPLVYPAGVIGVEFHHRPNTPAWAPIDPRLVIETAEPSRTAVACLLRPRDDLHALLLALHCWKGGFVKIRDLLDALLLATVSERDVADTAAELGLGHMWSWTVRLAESELFGRSSPHVTVLRTLLSFDRPERRYQRRTRLLMPYLVANPIRVTSGQLRDYRLGQEARRRSTTANDESSARKFETTTFASDEGKP